ncbi:MAG TPA: cupin domain-containing protein [Candidatus Acidoferrum sp.]|nr:cupin domain-containing protein [Candidatus Acidoferrum sp.]
MHTINLADKFGKFQDFWNPRILGELNDFAVKAVKVKGEFVWHHHDVEDELFLVVKGTLRMRFRDREEIIREGEFIIVPHGVEHLPVADEEVHVILLEPKSTLNTGNIANERTVHQLEHI